MDNWIVEEGWARREGSYARCLACDLPVDKVTSDTGICEECWIFGMTGEE